MLSPSGGADDPPMKSA